MNTVPSSSMSTEHPVSSMMERIMRPPGPITAPILSCGTVMRNMRGAKGDMSLRGSAMIAEHLVHDEEPACRGLGQRRCDDLRR